MKFKLPLLLLLSLMWQAASSADEWTNIATAVTVTEGRLCAGEIAADGTGTDILCDTDHPYIDSSGNVGIGTTSPANSLTVVGDISATTINTTQLCDENGANCRDLSSTDSMVVSTTTMVVGFPDAIKCTVTDPAWGGAVIFYPTHAPHGPSGYHYFRLNHENGTIYGLIFTGGGLFVGYEGGVVSSADCNKSIAQLYADGQAFNFLGNNGAQISLTEIADVSAAAPSEGEVLSWNNSTSRWEPSATASAIDALGDIGDVSSTVATEGQVLAWDSTNSEWAPADTMAGSFSCPAGFTLIQNAGQTLGCIQTSIHSGGTVDWVTAVDTCYDNYGGRLPMHAEWYLAAANSLLSDATTYRERLADSVYHDSTDSHFTKESGSTTNTHRAYDTTSVNFRCFIPASGQISMTTVYALSDVSASAPTDGQLLSYDASENEWVATDVISKTIIYNSIDDDPCVVTGGVRKLSFNPTTGRLRVCRP